MSGTRVRVSAFEVEFSNNMDIGSFYQSLEALERKEIPIVPGRRCLLLTDIVGGYIVGIALNFRDDKKNVVTVNNHNKLEVVKNSLKDNEHNTEATVFLMHPETKMGLLYTYMGGGNSFTLKKVMTKAHRYTRRILVKQKLDELTKLDQKKRKQFREKAEEHYSGDFNFTLKMQQKDIDKLINSFSRIESVEVSVDHLIGKVSEFSPIENLQKRSKTTFLISDAFRDIKSLFTPLKQLYAKFSGHVLSHDEVFKLVGKSINGEPLSGVIGDNIEEFGFMKYDSYIEKLPSDIWDNYKKSKALGALINIAQSKNHIFGRKNPPQKWKMKSAKDLNGGSNVPS